MVRGLMAAVLAASQLLVPHSDTSLTAGGGWDISWPQCTHDYPQKASSQFAVVGVTGGRPFTHNPCLSSQFIWASEGSAPIAFYVNLAYGVRDRQTFPCDPPDAACYAWVYGFESARYAYDYAFSESFGLSASVKTWWLDVETANRWSDDQSLNAQVIEGALYYLREAHGLEVGVYSARFMWVQIVGGYAPAEVPNWVGGASGPEDRSRCRQGFWPGAVVRMYQFDAGDFDRDFLC